MDLSLIVSGFTNTSFERPHSPPTSPRAKSDVNHIASPPSSDDEFSSAEPESPVCSHGFNTETIAQSALLSRTLALGEQNPSKFQIQSSNTHPHPITPHPAAGSAAQIPDSQCILVNSTRPVANTNGFSKTKLSATLSPIQHLHSPAFSEVEGMETPSYRRVFKTSLQSAPAVPHNTAALLTSLPMGTAPDAAHRRSCTTSSIPAAMDKPTPDLSYLSKHQRGVSQPFVTSNTALQAAQAVAPRTAGMPIPVTMSVPVITHQPYQIYQVAVPNGYPIPLPSQMMPRISQLPLEMSQAAYDAANTLCYQRTHPTVSCRPPGNQIQVLPGPIHAGVCQAAQPTQTNSIAKHSITTNCDAIAPTDSPLPERKDLSDVEAQRRGLRVHSCKTCGRSFGRKSGLIRHERIHLGIRPNVCQVCRKSFLQRSALTVHLRVHTGEKPYSCPMCHRQFSDSSSLARHRRIHLRDGAANDSRASISTRSPPEIHASGQCHP